MDSRNETSDSDLSRGPRRSRYDSCRIEVDKREEREEQGAHFDTLCDVIERIIEVDVAVDSFEEISPNFDEIRGILDPRLIDNCRNRLKFQKLTPIQTRTIPIMLKTKEHLLTSAPTGVGKTASFLLPSIQMILEEQKRTRKPRVESPQVLILNNTGNLAMQTYRFGLDLLENIDEVHIGALTGDANISISEVVKSNIIVATMGKLKAACESKKISFDKLKWLIIDEADLMVKFDTFGPYVEEIYDEFPLFVKDSLRVMFFSATFDSNEHGSVIFNDLQMKLTRDESYASVVVRNISGLIDHELIEIKLPKVVGIQDTELVIKFERLKKMLNEDLAEYGAGKGGPYEHSVAVFVETKKRAVALTAMLIMYGYNFDCYSSEMTGADQDNTLDALKKRKIHGVVSTNKMARGTDVSSLAHIINFDFSPDIDWTLHRIGRTGRAGKAGKCSYFIVHPTPRDFSSCYKFYLYLRDIDFQFPRWFLALVGLYEEQRSVNYRPTERPRAPSPVQQQQEEEQRVEPQEEEQLLPWQTTNSTSESEEFVSAEDSIIM
ncbi:unnamed protein product [Caenorhabditis auriculariae]|uniref:ATP-dependent RNA helicase n=1 Tax=Caenorhabditis auriculariae TaxID=2777116 RepID=A0A8S1HLB3_9PELO|nr:unnamed protein product [Caenorhabditis auriculariae]